MRFMLVCFAFIFTAFTARADIAPEPDRGPLMASAGGLDFAIRSGVVKFPPGYTKTLQVAVLVETTHERHAPMPHAMSRSSET